MESRAEVKDFMRVVNYHEDENSPSAQAWKTLIKKSMKDKLFFSLNVPVLLISLFLWGGIFGGLWFTYRGRFIFGTFIWPCIVVGVYLSIVTFLELPAYFLGISTTGWYTASVIISSILTPFLLASIANPIYLQWVKKQIETGQQEKLLHLKFSKVIYSFICLLLICACLPMLKLPVHSPIFFYL